MESMGYEMRDLHPYERLDSNASRETALEADQGPLGDWGEPPQPRIAPRSTKYFDSARQTRTLLFKGTLRWIVTVILTALTAVTLRFYEEKRNFPSDQKAVFNTIITALILGCGLNLFVSHNPAKAKRLAAHSRWLTMSQEAFKESARVVRWRILAEEPHTKREADLILGIENLLNVWVLGRDSYKKPRVSIPCVLWLLFNLLAQISVASISLTYTVDDGRTYSDTYSTQGTVNAPNLTTYFSGTNAPLGAEDFQAVAHTYGEVAKDGKNCEPYEDIAQVYKSSNDPPYFCRRTSGKQEFAYRFKEHNYDDNERIYPSFTNRVITASSGKCFKYTELNHTIGPDLYNNMAAIKYSFSNSTYDSSISIPISSEGWTATTYVYRGPKPPHLVKANSCGDRCKWVWAHRATLPGHDTSTFYQCPITISKVGNATDLQDIPESVARVAAASIALQGRWAGPTTDKIWTQYQFYAVFTPWETHFTPDERVGANMAEFALRSLATMAERNPFIRISGRVPHLGSRLSIYNHWRYVVALFACIIGVHFALLVASAWVTKSVVVPDDSFMAIAGLLNERGRRRDDKMKRHEQGEEQTTGETSHTSDGIVYGPLSMDRGYYVLHLGESVNWLKQWEGGRHPHGYYF